LNAEFALSCGKLFCPGRVQVMDGRGIVPGIADQASHDHKSKTHRRVLMHLSPMQPRGHRVAILAVLAAGVLFSPAMATFINIKLQFDLVGCFCQRPQSSQTIAPSLYICPTGPWKRAERWTDRGGCRIVTYIPETRSSSAWTGPRIRQEAHTGAVGGLDHVAHRICPEIGQTTFRDP
jgi:hypothetical protein